jgi:hypothetical protein
MLTPFLRYGQACSLYVVYFCTVFTLRAGSPVTIKWPVHYTLNEVQPSNNMKIDLDLGWQGCGYETGSQVVLDQVLRYQNPGGSEFC